MNRSDFLEVVKHGNAKDITDYIDNDKEYQEYRKEHPLPDRSNLTREEKTEYLLSLLKKLGLVKEETPEEIAAKNEYKALDELLGYQCLTDELDHFYHTYIKRKQAEGADPCLLIIDIFNYGIICGKRAERARRKGEQV